MSGKHGNGRVRRPRMMVMDLVLVLILLTITYTARASAASDPIFSEGGGAVPYALEEEILEELSRGQEAKNEDRDFVGVSSANKEQAQPKAENVAPEAPATKDQQPQQQPSVQPQPQPQPRPQQPVVVPVAPVASSSSESEGPKRPPQSPPGANPKQTYEDLKSAAAAAIMKQTNALLHKEEQKPAKQKKEGQEEFATFVDPFSQPAQNRRLAAEKPSYSGHYGHEEKRASVNQAKPNESDDLGDTVFIAVTTVCSAAAVFGLMGAGVCWYRLHKQYKSAQDAEYPHYGVTGPAKERSSGSASPVAAMDAKLASSAQLYHYQHTKQQIIAMEHSTSDAKGQESEDSEGEGDEGDFSVYECPGLAPTGDIEVSNPLFENMASPHAKVDPRQQQGDDGQSPHVHKGSPVRGEDP